MTKERTYLLGWCDPAQAHFWGLDEPSHRCLGVLGNIVCACSCHGRGPGEGASEPRTPGKRRVVRRKQ